MADLSMVLNELSSTPIVITLSSLAKLFPLNNAEEQKQQTTKQRRQGCKLCLTVSIIIRIFGILKRRDRGKSKIFYELAARAASLFGV